MNWKSRARNAKRRLRGCPREHRQQGIKADSAEFQLAAT
jgi:hypothetical protein